MKLETVRCPHGVTEQDVAIFFEQLFGQDSDHSTATREATQAKCAVFTRLKTNKLQHTTLRYLCPWGAVQFVPGKSRRYITVDEDGKIHVGGCLTSLAGLFLGLFRLLVAATCTVLFILKLFYMLHILRLLKKETDRGRFLALTLLFLRSATETFVCLLLTTSVAGDSKPRKLQTTKVWLVRAVLFLYLASNPLAVSQWKWYPMCYFPSIPPASNYAMIAFFIVSFTIFIACCLCSINPWEFTVGASVAQESAPPDGRESEARHMLNLSQRMQTVLAACIAILGAASIGSIHLTIVLTFHVDKEVLLGEASACLLCFGWSVWIARKMVMSFRCSSCCSSKPVSTSLEMQSSASRVSLSSPTSTVAPASSLIDAGDFEGFLFCVTTLWSSVVMSFFCMGSGQITKEAANCDFTIIPLSIISVSAMPVIGFLVSICSLRILVCVRTGQFKSGEGTVLVHTKQTHRSLSCCRCILSLVKQYAPTRDLVKHYLSILSTTMALIALLAVFLALPLPWLKTRVSFSEEFKTVSTNLKRLSSHLDQYSIAIRLLTGSNLCSRDALFDLGHGSLTDGDIVNVDTGKIITLCSKSYCHLQLLNKSKDWQLDQSEDFSSICKNYCVNKAFFENSDIRFDSKKHHPKANSVRGNRYEEIILLEQIVDKDKSDLQKNLTLAMNNIDINVSSTNPNKHSKRLYNKSDLLLVDTTEIGSSSASDDYSQQCQDNEAAVILFSGGNYQDKTSNNTHAEADAVNIKVEKSEEIGMNKERQLISGEKSHRDKGDISRLNVCQKALCALQIICQFGIFLPIVHGKFAGMLLAIEALLFALEMLVKASKLSEMFDDMSHRLKAIVLYLERGSEERTVYLSVSNYTIVYLAYPAVIAGCVGVLMGFWPRGDPLSSPYIRHRGRRLSALLLPLLALNGVGAAVMVLWTSIVDYLAGYISLFKISSTTDFGAHILLVAFICGFGSCLSSLILLGCNSRDRRLQYKKKMTLQAAVDQNATNPSRQESSTESNATDLKRKSRKKGFSRSKVWLKSKKEKGYNFWDSAVSWWLTFFLVALACGVMTSTLWLSFFNISVKFRPFVDNIFQDAENGGSSINDTVKKFIDQSDDSCNLVTMIVKEVLKLIWTSRADITILPLMNQFYELKTKAEKQLETVPGLIVYPCFAAHATATVIVLFGILARLCGYQTLSPESAARCLRRLSLLSMAWLMHMTLIMMGPAASVASPVVAEVKVNVGPGFLAAVAAHLLLILASRELKLSLFAPAKC